MPKTKNVVNNAIFVPTWSGPDIPVRSYFKVWFKEGVFYETDPGNMRLVVNGGNDAIFAVTFFGSGDDPHRKRNFVEYLNQIVPLAASEAGAIAVSQLGFNDYGEYHELHPNG